MADKLVSLKLKTGRVGDRFAQYAGDIIEVSPDEAKRMLAAGQAEAVRDVSGASERRG